MNEEQTRRTVVTYACPNCRAGLVFDPAKAKFTCEFCLSEFSEEELLKTDAAKNAREDFENADDYCAHMNDYLCPNCGAEITADENTAADFCPWCHNPVVLRGKLRGQMKPDRIVPFSVDAARAREIFLAWAKKRRFAPRSFTDPAQVDKLRGVYYPFWITDADTAAEMRAHTTRVRTWKAGNRLYTETSHFLVERDGEIHFEDITTSALTDADKEMLEGVLPFPSESLRSFDPAFLTGFLAKKRDIERASLTGEVKGKMNSYAETMLRDTVRGYGSVSVENLRVDIFSSHWEYSLLPVWLLIYKGQKKDYPFAINGETGKVYGRVPLSLPRLMLFGAGAFLASFLIFLLLFGGLI